MADLPSAAFDHAASCPIVRADPGYEPQWEEVEPGHFRRRCHAQCGAQDVYAGLTDRRPRQDPLDPSTWPVMNHLGWCEYRDTTDPALLRAILKVRDAESYYVIDCSACEALWRVPYHAAESVG